MENLFRETPWDSKVFGLTCCELVGIDSESSIQDLNSDIDKLINEFGFLYGRVSVGNRTVRTFLSSKGFIGAESSALAKLTKLQKRDISSKLPSNIFLKNIDNPFLEKSIIEGADNMYSFSRFHESPFIDRKLANERMKRWIIDVISNDTPCLVLVLDDGEKEQLLGYMFFTEIDSKVNLLLGGVVKGAELHALTLWRQVLLTLQGYGVKTVTARISLSNSGVVKLYQQLDFNLSDFLIDYQRVKN